MNRKVSFSFLIYLIKQDTLILSVFMVPALPLSPPYQDICPGLVSTGNLYWVPVLSRLYGPTVERLSEGTVFLHQVGVYNQKDYDPGEETMYICNMIII